MAVDFTGLIITAAELRKEIGDPSLNPSSETYVTDATLTDLIDRYEQIAQNLVDQQIANLTIDKMIELGLQVQSELVEFTPATNVDYPNMYVIAITSTYIPIPIRVVDQTSGNELSRDDDLVNSRRAANGIFTIRRYVMDGDVLVKFPANADVLSIQLVTKLKAENLLKGPIATQVNAEIVAAARITLRDRMQQAGSFRNENKVEGP
jgi:hypothetical protein